MQFEQKSSVGSGGGGLSFAPPLRALNVRAGQHD
jgi:hypothetical protein